MRRQNKQGLDQGDQKDGNHHQWNNPNEFPHNALNKNKGHESGNRGQDREGHRYCHLAGTVNRRFQVGFSQLPMFKYILTHHDSIIHHNAQGHDKGEQRNHINGNIQTGHNHQGAQKRNWNAKHYPQGQTNLQKHAEHNENHDEPENGVFQKQF